MSRWIVNDLYPAFNDSDNVLLKKIARRLELNAQADPATPSSNVAVTNTPLPIQFSATQPVNVLNTPTVNANITNASIPVTSSGEFAIISRIHKENHEGHAFVVTDEQTITAGNSYLWMFTTPAAPFEVHLFSQAHGTAEMRFSIYETPVTPVGGAAVDVICRNRLSPQANVITIVGGLSVASNGTKLYSALAGSGKDAGGVTQGEHEFLLARSTNYLLEIQAIENGDFNLELHWYYES